MRTQAVIPTIYLGTFIHLELDEMEKLDICEAGAIGVAESGVIEFVERDVKNIEAVLVKHPKWKDAKVVQTKEGQFFFPGFIDTHIHASQYPNAGVFGKSSLLNWLNTYTFPLESSLKNLSKARTVYSRCVSRTLSHGTTTAAYYATIHVPSTNLLADICHAVGQRAFIGRCCMDNPDINPDFYRDESPEKALESTLDTIAHIKSLDPQFSLVSPIITPRFAPSCTSDLLHMLGQLAKDSGLPCQTHISENLGEVELVGKLFPGYGSYAEIYDGHGLLTARMILAHAIHLSAAEKDLIRERGAKISHCPASNSALTSGCARVRSFLGAGITVGLGTDMSGGYSPSMLEAVRQTALVSRHVAMTDGDDTKLTVEEALYLGTRGGARVVGLEKKIGGFDVGMEWDALLIGLTVLPDPTDGMGNGETAVHGEPVDKSVFWIEPGSGPVDIFGWENWEERVAKWVYNGDDRNIMSVWVQGKNVHTKNN